MLAQGAQLLAHQRPAVVGPHGHQLHLAAGEVQHLQRAGVLDQAADVFGDQLLGADQHVDGQGVVREQLGIARYSAARTRAILVGV